MLCQVLRKLVHYDPAQDLVVHVAMDNTLIVSEVKEACLSGAGDRGEGGESEPDWTPLLLFISLRLGLTEINPVYQAGLLASFTLKHSLGVIGGSPNKALYLLGCVDQEVESDFICWSPHYCAGGVPGPAHDPGGPGAGQQLPRPPPRPPPRLPARPLPRSRIPRHLRGGV